MPASRKWKEHGGCLIVGTEGMIKSIERQLVVHAVAGGQVRPVLKAPPQTLPRSGSHERVHRRLQGRTGDDVELDYAGPLVDSLLANVATLWGETLEFDPLGCKVVAMRRPTRPGGNIAKAGRFERSKEAPDDHDDLSSASWFYWAILSAVFAALTAIFAKIGIRGVDSDLATLVAPRS